MRRKNTTSEMMKQYIAESLLLLMAKKPYESIKIGEITAKAGVDRSTYYRNFGSKGEIVKFYFEQIIFRHMETIPSREQPLNEYLFAMFTHYYRFRKQLLLIYRAGLAHLILETLNKTFSELVSDISLENLYALYYHTGGIYNNFLLWFSNDMNETPDKMTRIACSFLPKDYKPFLPERNIIHAPE